MSTTDQDTNKKCVLCDLPLDECTCCAECGHVCPRDQGESYCPICLPEPGR